MSIFSKIESGVSKATQFLVCVFTRTSAVLAVLQKISPATLAAILAVFHDVMGFVQEGIVVAGEIETGQLSTAIGTVLSPTTQTLLTGLKNDLVSGEKTILDDFDQLGVAVKTTPAA